MADSDDGYVSGTAYASSDDDDIFEIQRMHSRAPSSNPGLDYSCEIVWDAVLLHRAQILLPVHCLLIIASFLDA